MKKLILAAACGLALAGCSSPQEQLAEKDWLALVEDSYAACNGTVGGKLTCSDYKAAFEIKTAAVRSRYEGLPVAEIESALPGLCADKNHEDYATRSQFKTMTKMGLTDCGVVEKLVKEKRRAAG